MVGDRTETEDVVQEVFLQVWKRAGRFRPEKSSAITWIMMITRSRAIDHFRRRSTERRRLVEVTSRQVESPGADAVGRIAENEGVGEALCALGAIPAKQREPLILAFKQGFSSAQIARQQSIPIGTAKTRARLAMARLRFALGSGSEDEWQPRAAVA